MGSNISMRCSSSLVPSVTVTRACVSPRVNSAEPCVRGSTPTSQSMLRISSKARPSGRRRRLQHLVAEDALLQRVEQLLGFGLLFLGKRLHNLLLGFVDAMVAFELGIFLGVQRVSQFLADLRLRCVAYSSLLIDRRPSRPISSCRPWQPAHGCRRRSSCSRHVRIRWLPALRLPMACCAPASTITMPSSVPATTILTLDSRVSS